MTEGTLGNFMQFGPLGEPAGSRYDVFISHAGSEKAGFVDFMVKEFRDAWPEVTVFLDRDSLQPGDTGPTRRDRGALEVIWQALGDAFVSVVVLSEAYLQRRDPMDELHLLLQRLRSNQGTRAKVVPVFFSVGWEGVRQQEGEYEKLAAVEPGSREARGWLATAPSNTLQQYAADVRMLKHITGFTAEQVQHGRATELIPKIVERTALLLHDMGKLQSRNLVSLQPDRTEKFVGLVARRDELLQRVQEAAVQGRAVVLCGMPGIGKTTLAADFFNHMHKADITVPCCFLTLALGPRPDGQHNSADEEHVLKLQHRLLHQLLRRRPALMPADIASGRSIIQEHFRQHLRATGKKIMLVVDNVWRGQLWKLLPENIMEVLAPGSTVLIVSRGPVREVCLPAGCRKPPVVHAMSCLDLQESLALVRNYLPNNVKLAKGCQSRLAEAVQRCGGLPRALVAIAENVQHDARGRRRDVEEMVLGACDGSAYADMRMSWDAVSDPYEHPTKAAERQQTLLDVVWFLKDQRVEWVEPYCRMNVLQELQEVGLVHIGRGSAGPPEERQHDAVKVHAAVADFCKLATSLRQFRLPMKRLVSRLPDDEVEGAVGLGLEGCTVEQRSCEALQRSKHLRVIQMDQNECCCQPAVTVLQLPSPRWTCCNQDRMPADISLKLRPSLDQSRPNYAVVVLKDLRELEAVTILDSRQMTRLRLEACPKLTRLEVSDTDSLFRLEVLGCGNLQEVTGLEDVEELHLECDTPHVLASLPGLAALTLEAPWPVLPDAITSLAMLEELHLHHCPSLATVSSLLEQLPNLTQLSVVDCPSLQHLAPPTTLRQLSISSCPLLTSVVALVAAAQEQQQQQ